MKFKINFFNNKINQEKNFLGILLKENEGNIFLLKLNSNSVNIVTKEKLTFSNNWDNLIEDIDEALYKLELKGFKTPDEVIFFVYGFVIDKYKREIKKDYLLKIKDIVKNLELKPLGYIEAQEAVVALIEEKDKMPLSSILIELCKTTLCIYFYKNGSIIYSEQIIRTQNIIEDAKPFFEKIKKDNAIPSRLIIYDGKEINIEVADMLSNGWTKNIFVHSPKIEIVKEDEITLGLIDIFSKKILKSQTVETNQNNKKEVMGFLINQDIDNQKTEYVQSENSNYDLRKESIFHKYDGILKSHFSSFSHIIKNIFKKILYFKYFKSLMLLIGLLLIVSGSILIEYFFHKADILIYVNSQKINKTLTISEIDIKDSNIIIPITISKKTTGKKETGEKAQGEVTIHNFDSIEKTFEKGTSIKSNNLVYLTDNDIKVASASLTSDSSAKLPGKNKIKITAQNIGSNYNLDSNKKFNIGDLSETDYFAINESAITGGNKKEIVIVSKDDIENLENQGIKQGEKKAKDSSLLRLQKNYSPIDLLTNVSLTSITYNKELGEEADNLTMKGAIKILFKYFKNTDLINNIHNNLNKDVKLGYILNKENVTYKITKAIEKSQDVILTVQVEAKAAEKINLKEIQNEVQGKKTTNIEKIINEKIKSNKFEYKISHPISIFKSWFPLFEKNINIKILNQ